MRSTAEAVLQEMDNISSIRQNREVERLRMWTGDTEEVSVDYNNTQWGAREELLPDNL